MGTKNKRIVLKVKDDDYNSQLFCEIVKYLPRGKRGTILSDIVLLVLKDHGLMETFSNNPKALAGLLEAFSEGYRNNGTATLNPLITPINMVSPDRLAAKNINTFILGSSGTGRAFRAVAPPELVQPESEPDEKPKEDTAPPVVRGVVEESPPEQTSDPGITYLSPEDYMDRQIQIGKQLVLKNRDQSRAEMLENDWSQMDREELYDELVGDPAYIGNNPDKLPKGYDSVLDYVTKTLDSQGIKKREVD